MRLLPLWTLWALTGCAGGARPATTVESGPARVGWQAAEALAERGPAKAERVPLPVAPCDLASAFESATEPRQLLRALSVLARSAATQDDVDCAVSFVEKHYPELARREPPPRDLEEFRDWYETFAGAVRQPFAPDRLTVLPERRHALDGSARQRLAPLLCPPGDEACGNEARELLRELERRLESLQRLYELERSVHEAGDVPPAGEDVALAQCASDALEKEPRYAYWAWRDCVVERIPKAIKAPRDAFRLPERGVLVLHRYGYWDPCTTRTALSLATGLTLTRVRCHLGETNQSAERWTLRRARPEPARRAALFAALLDELRESPAYAASFPIPSGIRKQEERRSWSGSLGPMVHDAPELTYQLEGVLAQPIEERRYVHDEVQPGRQLVVQLLLPLTENGRAGCVEAGELPSAATLVSKIIDGTGHDERAQQVLEQLKCLWPPGVR